MIVENLALRTYDALVGIWPDLVIGLINGLLILIVALLVLTIGWLISAGIGQLVTRILNALRFNQYFEKAGWKEALEKAEIKMDATAFVGGIFKWIAFIIVLTIVAEILGLVQFATLLDRILGYLPNVIVAVFIFVAAVIIAEILEKIVRTAVEGTKVGYGALAGVIVKWSIWVFAILAILRQLLVVPDLISTVFNALIYGVVALLVISFGIAFGLGGKDVAAEILRDLKRKLLS